jgi:hypothetical protein
MRPSKRVRCRVEDVASNTGDQQHGMLRSRFHAVEEVTVVDDGPEPPHGGPHMRRRGGTAAVETGSSTR